MTTHPHQPAPSSAPTPWRALREAAGISLRELARRTEAEPEGAINPGRLSIIERGVTPTEDEAKVLKRLLGAELTGA